jgi:streptomycin 6-kinase
MTEPFTALADEARRWTENLPTRWVKAGRPFERLLVDGAIESLAALAGTQGDQVLLHQDLHGHNVLRAAREPWLAIDPKPLHGEVEFALAPIVRSYELGHSRLALLQRQSAISSRPWGWTGLAPGTGASRGPSRGPSKGSTTLHTHLETARWLLTA